MFFDEWALETLPRMLDISLAALSIRSSRDFFLLLVTTAHIVVDAVRKMETSIIIQRTIK